MTVFQLSYLLLWALALVLIPISMALLYLLAQLREQSRREGAGYGNNLIGREMPAFATIDLGSGQVVEITECCRGRAHVILALSPDCGTCRSLINELTDLSNRSKVFAAIGDIDRMHLVLLCMGDFERCKDAVARTNSIQTLTQNERTDATVELWHAGFPAALFVDETGHIVDVRHPLSLKGLAAAAKSVGVSIIHSAKIAEHRGTAAMGLAPSNY